jgi:hypothetical protein
MTATRVTTPARLQVGVREARLHPEFAQLYPAIPPGEWLCAAILADRVLVGRLLRGASSAIMGRVLPEEHFEFRGGEQGSRGERDGYRLRREVR